jgi:hypothetical protein
MVLRVLLVLTDRGILAEIVTMFWFSEYLSKQGRFPLIDCTFWSGGLRWASHIEMREGWCPIAGIAFPTSSQLYRAGSPSQLYRAGSPKPVIRISSEIALVGFHFFLDFFAKYIAN